MAAFKRRLMMSIGAMFIACIMLTPSTGGAQQFNTKEGTNYTTSDSAFRMYWDSANDQLKVMAAPSGTGGGSITWAEGIVVDTTGDALFQVGNDTGSCTAAKNGRLRYNGSDTWEYCNGSAWSPFEQAGSITIGGPADCPDIGDQCADGTIYAGYHPTLQEQLFIHTSDQSTGTSWNDGTTNWVTTNCDDAADGRANTECLAALSGSGSPAPYAAAELCDDLSANGHTDWYLPSRVEAFHLWVVKDDLNAGPMTDFASSNYWTSSENSLGSTNAWYQALWSNGGSTSVNKNQTTHRVRCMRREAVTGLGAVDCSPPASCSSVGDVCSDGSIFAGFLAYGDATCEPLYVTASNQSTSSQWKTSTGTDDIIPDDSIDGEANAANRSGTISDFPAFDLCESNTYHTKSDWYLPSRFELQILWNNRVAINANASENFASSNYWSSTEHNLTSSWYQVFSNGFWTTSNKGNGYNIRCVRRD